MNVLTLRAWLFVAFSYGAISACTAQPMGRPGHTSPGLATQTAQAPAEGNWVYRYRLIHLSDTRVCQHMQQVYDQKFHRPWHFREFFATLDSRLADRYYGSPAAVWNNEETSYWTMRYALYPTSPEFGAIHWTPVAVELVPGQKEPMRWAEVDIDNSGAPSLVVQSSFYGRWRWGEPLYDELRVLPAGSIDMRGSTLDHATLYPDGIADRKITGDIVRPFRLNGVTYLSVYSANGGVPDAIPHQHPETMSVKKAVRANARAAIEMATVCEFEMTPSWDPIS